jgi:flagellar secretion chaperone FliS
MSSPTRRYLESRILTASKGELFLMLFDGAIRFSEQAKPLLLAKDIEAAGKLLLRAQDVVLELLSYLRREDGPPEVYDNLAALYRFVHGRLVSANMKSDPALIDEAVRILSHLRETWAKALAAEQAARTPDPVAGPAGAVNLEG